MADFYISPETRQKYPPSADYLNVSMDFNASPEGGARGTEVVIPDDASPEVRAAAERYNALVADFAQKHGIEGYPVRGVKTRSENQRGVPNTVHVEPFFNTDVEIQRAIQQNPEEFAEIYRTAFGDLSNARLIAPHGQGEDRGAVSEIFGDETSYGKLIAETLLGNEPDQRTDAARRAQYGLGDRDPGTTVDVLQAVQRGDMTKDEAGKYVSEELLEGIEGGSTYDQMQREKEDEKQAMAVLGQGYEMLSGSDVPEAPRARSLSRYGPRLSPGRPPATPGTQAIGRLGLESLLANNPLLGIR